MRPDSGFGVLLLSVFFVTASTVSQTTRPDKEKPVFANEFVRAYEVTLKKGEKLPPHESGDRLIYSLNAYSLKYTWGDRSTIEKRTAGDLHYHPAGVHSEENAGPSAVSFLMIERTATPLPPVELSGQDMAEMSPHNTKVLFDRTMAKVFEVTLPPRDAVAMHLGLHRLIYALTAFDLMMKSADGKEMKATGKKGSFRWEQASIHSVENPSNGTARVLVFSFKK